MPTGSSALSRHPTLSSSGSPVAPRNDYFCIIDDSHAGYSEVGTWANIAYPNKTGLFETQRKTSGGGSGANVATWTFTGLPIGDYDVHITFNSGSQVGPGGTGATNVPYTVYDNTSSLGTTIINQSIDIQGNYSGTPPFELTANGTRWKLIGRYTISSGTLKVTVSDNTGTPVTVFSDAVRVSAAYLGDPCRPPTNFIDDFSDAAIACKWFRKGGTWSESGGIFQQTANVAAKAAVWHDHRWEPKRTEVRAKVRVDNWSGGDSARAGVGLCMDKNGNGYNLIFHSTTSKVEFLEDGVAHGNSYVFNWSVGTWYWFRLRRDGGTLYGKIWQDGADEPATWPYTQTISGVFNDRSDGYPGLNGGDGSSLASFDNFIVTPLPSYTACATLSRHPNIAIVAVLSVAGSTALSRHPTLVSGGTFSLQFTGTSARSRHPTISSTGLRQPPQYPTNVALSRHPGFSSSGISPNYFGSAALSKGKSISATGIFAGPATGNLPLVIKGSANTHYVSTLTLAIKGHSPFNSNIPLYTVGKPAQVNSSITLVLPSWTSTFTPGLNLFLKGQTPTLIRTAVGVEPFTPSPTLFIRGTQGVEFKPNTYLPLYLRGYFQSVSNDLNLYLQNSILSNTIPLFIQNGHPVKTGTLPLFIEGVGRSTNSIPLFILSGGASGSLNLFLKSEHSRVSGMLTLFVKNSSQISSRKLPLYIRGQGVGQGTQLVTGVLNLHLQRGANAGITLYLENKHATGTIPLFIGGQPKINSIIPLFVRGRGEQLVEDITLFIKGISPTMINNSLTLVAPKTVDEISRQLDLFISGYPPL